MSAANNQHNVSIWLATLAEQGVLRQIDVQLAGFIARQEKKNPAQIAWISALLSRELGQGHICLNLDGRPLLHLASASSDPELVAMQSVMERANWPQLLNESNVVGAPGEALPLIYDGTRLYFHRYWFYEAVLAEQLSHFAEPIGHHSDQLGTLKQTLDYLFARDYRLLFDALGNEEESDTPPRRQRLVCEYLDIVAPQQLDWAAIEHLLLNAQGVDELRGLDTLVPVESTLNWQKVAAAVALTRRFTVISGGPGTGKTTTVAKLLAALVAQHSDSTPLIRLVAPTGKAAARLTESIGRAIAQLPIDPQNKAAIPTQASTLHRLLGTIPDSISFRHHAGNKLHLDILVVDEASMVDLPLMYKLFDALPAHARMILLGDKDQLASVEAGAVLGDICSFIDSGYSREQGLLLSQLTGFNLLLQRQENPAPVIADSLCMLQKSYRFTHRSGIGQLAKAVNQGALSDIEQIWQKGYADIEFHSLNGTGYSHLISSVVAAYRDYLQLALQPNLTPAQIKPIIDSYNRCRLLCAVREGEFGVAGLNQRIEQVLVRQHLIPDSDDLWYVGRPIMISCNDYNLGLYNGDIGICLADPESEEGKLKVYFELADGQIKGILPSRIPAHDTAFAMTIHKSQGSEFATTFMLLPADFSPLLTRELVYTGITRAKKKLLLYADSQILKRAVAVKTERLSGLTARLK